MSKKLYFDGSKIKNITNLRSGLLVAIVPIGVVYNSKYKMRDAIWQCLCDCGNIYKVRGAMISNGHTKSCGCVSYKIGTEKRTKHGKAARRKNDTTYFSWQNMIQRCTNPKATGYIHYGGRGITVCDRWLNSFKNFLEDMGEKPESLTIDRIDNDGNYCKENCRWANDYIQAANKRTTTSQLNKVVGVQWVNESQMWRARMKRGGKIILDNYFRTEELAIQARLKAEETYKRGF